MSDLLDVIYALWVKSFGVMVDQEEVRTKLDAQLAQAAAEYDFRKTASPTVQDAQAQRDLMAMMPPARRRDEK